MALNPQRTETESQTFSKMVRVVIMICTDATSKEKSRRKERGHLGAVKMSLTTRTPISLGLFCAMFDASLSDNSKPVIPAP